MSNKHLYIALILLFLGGCASQKHFDREKELRAYLADIQHLDTHEPGISYVFILNNSLCGTCVDETLAFIRGSFSERAEKKIILTGRKSVQMEKLFADMKNTVVLPDKENKLAKYGLAYTTDYMFELKNGKIEYWNYLGPNTLLKLEKKYKK